MLIKKSLAKSWRQNITSIIYDPLKVWTEATEKPTRCRQTITDNIYKRKSKSVFQFQNNYASAEGRYEQVGGLFSWKLIPRSIANWHRTSIASIRPSTQLWFFILCENFGFRFLHLHVALFLLPFWCELLPIFAQTGSYSKHLSMNVKFKFAQNGSDENSSSWWISELDKVVKIMIWL